MSTGFGYDMILLSVKGPGGARVAPARLRAPRRPRHHASPPKKRRGQRRHNSPTSSRSLDRARRTAVQESTAPRRDGRTATPGDDAPRMLPLSTALLRPKKNTIVRSGQRRGVTRLDDMSERPDVRGATNGPPMRRWNIAASSRAAGFLPGTRSLMPRTWAILDHLTQATAGGRRTRMFLRRRAGSRL